MKIPELSFVVHSFLLLIGKDFKKKYDNKNGLISVCRGMWYKRRQYRLTAILCIFIFSRLRKTSALGCEECQFFSIDPFNEIKEGKSAVQEVRAKRTVDPPANGHISTKAFFWKKK